MEMAEVMMPVTAKPLLAEFMLMNPSTSPTIATGTMSGPATHQPTRLTMPQIIEAVAFPEEAGAPFSSMSFIR